MQIMMLGPRAVGKTTALASMYDKFNDTALSVRLRLTPLDAGTVQMLEEKLQEIQLLFATTDEQFLPTLPGDKDDKRLEFRLERLDRRYAKNIPVTFYDYPGGRTLPDDPLHETVVKNINDSIAYMLTIDSAALMENGGAYHRLINRPAVINELLLDAMTRAATDSNSARARRLIILAPLKCETYLNDRTRKDELMELVREEYAPVIELAQQMNNQFALVITPMQTMGNVVFDHITDTSTPQFIFRKEHPNVRYQPVGVELPLLILLNFVLHYYKDTKTGSFPPGPFQWIQKQLNNWFLDKDLENAINSLAARVSTYNDYEIVSGEALLSIE